MRYLPALLCAVLPGLAAAQRQPPPTRGAAAITSADVRRRIDLIAADSMLGRATPSPQLDLAAAYVASEFRRFGLKPGGDSGTYLQRYPLDILRFDPESAAIRVTGRPPATWRGGREVLLIEGQAPEKPTAGSAVVITGSPDGGALDSAAVGGKVVFVAVGPGFNALAGKLLPLRPLAMMLVAGFPDSLWQRLPGRAASTRVHNPSEGGGVPVPAVFAVRSATVAPLFAQGGAPPDSLRAWGVRPLAAHPLTDVALELDVRERVLQHTAAPNVIGILEGSDPALSKEYVLFTAHLDHIGTPGAGEGCVARGGDSICNGADDDGSGSVAVLELAQAFASAAERPKRSLVFMTVSGEERGLWGSAYFADHPTVPLASVIADLNSDMVGRNAKDTLAVIGREQSNLGAMLDSVAAEHRDLSIKPVGDLWPQEGLYYRSDHYNFARKGVPILFFTTGLHPDYHQVSDSPDKIDTEKEARFARLVFYLGLAVANATQRPRWNPQSYRQIVGGTK
ncbi:MAG TPA: M28 family peptidase [Gemmatimonadales bacterium]|nr:M28 family peptidase [Gemmatimonadales bacterium]